MAIDRWQGQWRQRQASDALASAAQQVAAQLHGPYRCLLQVPSSQWPTGGLRSGRQPRRAP